MVNFGTYLGQKSHALLERIIRTNGAMIIPRIILK